MRSVRLSALVAGAVCITLGAYVSKQAGHPGKLQALETTTLADHDGDLLPDSLEWVTMSDPRNVNTFGDERGDFLRTVQHIPPLANDPRPEQDEMRVLVSNVGTGSSATVWLHMLFRFVGNRVGTVQAMVPFIGVGTHQNSVKIPVRNLIGAGPLQVRSSYDVKRGTLIIVSAQIAMQSDLAYVLPCTVGAEIVIDNKRFLSGTYVTHVDSKQVAVMPIDRADRFAYQPVNSDEQGSNPFWNTNSVCLMKLMVVGSGIGGQICEVTDADCEIANGLRCAPICRNSRGKIIFVPDGLGTITGG